MDERVLSRLFTRSPQGGPENPIPSPTRSPCPGHRRAPPIPWPRGCDPQPRPHRTSAIAWAPGAQGPEPQPPQSPPGLGRHALPGSRRGDPARRSAALSRPGAAPRRPPARPPAGRPRTVWDCRLWLASMAAVSGTVSSSSTLPTGGFSIKAIPGRQSATGSGPEAGTRGADSRRPPGSAAAAAVNTRRPTRRRHPLGPRGPNADRTPPRSLSILAALRAAASREVLAPNFRSHRYPEPAPPKSSRTLRKPCILSTRPLIRGHFTLSHHPQRCSDPKTPTPGLCDPGNHRPKIPKPNFSVLGFSH